MGTSDHKAFIFFSTHPASSPQGHKGLFNFVFFAHILFAAPCRMPTDELPCVTGLSSDSSVEWEPQVKARPKKRARSKKLPAVADESELDGKAAVEAALRKTLTKSCPCKTRQCFNVFREDAKFADLLELRLDWNNLHKLDQDRMEPQRNLHLTTVFHERSIQAGVGAVPFC